MSGAPPLLSVADLRVEYRSGPGSVRAVDGVSLELAEGETLGIVGESGAGKSSALMAVPRLLPRGGRIHPDSRIRIRGEDVSALDPEDLRRLRARDIGVIFQQPGSSLNPVHRAGRAVAEAVREGRGLSGGELRREVLHLLGRAGLEDPERVSRAYPHQLSGGMQQRVLNALATVGSPELVIADEPTAGLDPDLLAATAAGLRRLTRRGAGVLVVTHDLRLAQQLGGHLALVYGGYVVETRPTADFFAGPTHPYGEGLLAALPERGGRPVPGQPVELTALPPGCAFAPRCPVRVAGCDESVPAPQDVPDTAGAGRGVVRCFRPREGAHGAAG